MKSKYIAWSAIVAALLAALFLLSLAPSVAGRPFLLAAPSGSGAQGLNIDAINDFEEFLVTYELRQNKNASSSKGSHSVTLIGTNSHYRDVLGYPMLHGGFFTEAAFSAGYRHAVLNKKAAVGLFGGVDVAGNAFKMDGESWSVAGVIDDGDETSNLYAPSSLTGGRPQSLMVLLDCLDGGGASEVYAINGLKTLGVRDSSFEFVNFQRMADAFGERFAVAWKAALCLLAILAFRAMIIKMASWLPGYRQEMKRMYLREFAAENPLGILKMLGGAILLACCVAAVLIFSMQVLGAFLSWRGLAMPSGRITDFSRLVDALKFRHYAGTAVFAAYLTALGILFAVCWRRKKASHGAAIAATKSYERSQESEDTSQNTENAPLIF